MVIIAEIMGIIAAIMGSPGGNKWELLLQRWESQGKWKLELLMQIWKVHYK